MPAAMDRHRRQRIERAVDCPYCMVRAGYRCIALDGGRLDAHPERVRAYERAHPRGGSDAARTVPVALGDAMPQYRALDDADKVRVREAMARAGRREMADIGNGRGQRASAKQIVIGQGVDGAPSPYMLTARSDCDRACITCSAPRGVDVFHPETEWPHGHAPSGLWRVRIDNPVPAKGRRKKRA